MKRECDHAIIWTLNEGMYSGLRLDLCFVCNRMIWRMDHLGAQIEIDEDTAIEVLKRGIRAENEKGERQ